AESRTGTFQSGAILEDAHLALATNGLRLGHDPWSRPIATIGGAISTNGVGYTASGHGAMGDQVLGLRVVLGDGEIVETRAVPGALFGPSLNHAFIGTEGYFGVVAEATVQAFPVPATREMLCFDFPEFDSGFEAINQMYAQGLRPTVMDYGDELASDGSGGRETATLYLAFEGSEKGVDADVSDTIAICSRHGGRRGSEAHVRRYWTNRHASALRYKRNILESDAPDAARKSGSAYRMDYLHVALPVGKVLEYRRKCERLLSNERVEVREWSVWGRPEFFSFLIGDSGSEDADANLGRTVDSVLTLAQSMGGTMEYCHGAGLKLAHLMDNELGTGMSAVVRIKKALDPAGILNPGKAWG
ncbi:MAG: FAD-binding oxidoreductase, partial [Dehalococcoidia bacterium]|nr:FAD-binding oxidoreductase [Dehalococcoidia bacterium]